MKKGVTLCNQIMREKNDVEGKKKLMNDCIHFYSKSLVVFEDNVKDKLKSLVKSLDFEEL